MTDHFVARGQFGAECRKNATGVFPAGRRSQPGGTSGGDSLTSTMTVICATNLSYRPCVINLKDRTAWESHLRLTTRLLLPERFLPAVEAITPYGVAAMSQASKSSGRRPPTVDHDQRFGLPVQDQAACAPFAAWLDGELDKLVSRWIHLASPRASRCDRAFRNRS